MNENHPDQGAGGSTQEVDVPRNRNVKTNVIGAREKWIEIASAALLALATVGSAWNAYQAAVWSGIQTFRLSEATAARTEAARLSNNALQLTTIDVGMFVQYAAARSTGNDQLADFLFERFRPELKTATEAWLATDPLENPSAPPSPFAMPEYSVEAQEQAERMTETAERRSEEAHQANQRSDSYVLLTVLFASVLFFGGISTKFRSERLRMFLIALGALIFIVAAGLLEALSLQLISSLSVQ